MDIDFANSLDEAKTKYKSHKSIDPFPEISPALLNSADIQEYVSATGMLFPFNINDVKSSSYRISILGKYVFWDQSGRKKVGELRKGERFVLRSNSLAFVSVEPFVQLPDYIAARFNLTVNNVYRGLLLGTGPMVDPGFSGHLSIPLHNFTPNDYTFTGGEHLISMEFTKVNPHPSWINKASQTNNKLVPYPTIEKIAWDVEDYLFDADHHRPIMSSIPLTFRRAEDAAKSAKRWVTIFQGVSLFAFIGLIVSVVSMQNNLSSMYERATKLVQDTENNYSNELSILKGSVKAQQDSIDHLKSRLEVMERLRRGHGNTPGQESRNED